jgi:5-enolpyruvylshikimate-3-phosphate synthase
MWIVARFPIDAAMTLAIVALSAEGRTAIR